MFSSFSTVLSHLFCFSWVTLSSVNLLLASFVVVDEAAEEMRRADGCNCVVDVEVFKVVVFLVSTALLFARSFCIFSAEVRHDVGDNDVRSDDGDNDVDSDDDFRSVDCRCDDDVWVEDKIGLVCSLCCLRASSISLDRFADAKIVDDDEVNGVRLRGD